MCFFANCCESPERAFRKKTQFLTIFALVKYREYRVIIVLKPQISCNIVWTFKKNIAQGWPERAFRKKNAIFDHVCACKISQISCDNRIKTPNIV